jgi:hypothetical protein
VSHTADGDVPEPYLHVVTLRIGSSTAEVALGRIVGVPGAGGQPEDVWTHRFANIESARIVAHLMMRRSDRWATWSRMATLLGADFLTGVIENEVVERSRQWFGEAEPVRRSARGAAPMVVEFSVHLDKPPRLVGKYNGEQFFVLEVGTDIAALRLWDWVRWQSESLPGWYRLAMAKGTIALEIEILDSTRRAELRAKADGRASDGPRPLRDWTP